MKKQRSSFYIKSQGPDASAIKKGLRWLIELSKKDNNKKSALLAVPTKQNLDGAISSVIGETNTKILKKNEQLTDKNIHLSLFTLRKPVSLWNGPVLAIYPNKKLIDKIDNIKNVTDVLIIPWYLDEVQYWIDTWKAVELGSNKPEQTTSALNPIVKVALKKLALRVNNGVTHPMDRSTAIEMFKILKKKKINYNPDEIRAFLITNKDWPVEQADNVKQIAADVLAGKRLRYQHKERWRKDFFETCKEEAKNAGI